jgi:acetyl-CoA carboxylase carboxyltransferase component
VAHFKFKDEDSTLEAVRKLLSYLPQNNIEDAPLFNTGDDPFRADQELAAIIPDSANKPYDVRRVIERVVDTGDFFEVQPDYAKNIVTGFARLAGRSIGIIANQPAVLAGVLDINASDKASRFIRFCDSFNIPCSPSPDTRDIYPAWDRSMGGHSSRGQAALRVFRGYGAKMTVILRKAYGGAYIAKCSAIWGPSVFAWPSAEIAVMGPTARQIIFKKEIEEAATRPPPGRKRSRSTRELRQSVQGRDTGLCRRCHRPLQTGRGSAPRSLCCSETQTLPARKHGYIPSYSIGAAQMN